jgi:solute carrier family 25 S-adenosylmethionine transporter 26
MMYKGCFGAATGAGIAIGAYFAFYGTAKKLLQEKSDMPVSQIAFVAGGIGALGSSIVKVPAAVCIRSVQAGVYPNVIAAGRRITAAAGPRGLFTGYIPTLLEDVPDMAVKFAAYETLRTMHRSFMKKSKDESSTGADIVMGLIAGSVAAAATTPLDVVKTRMMCNASSRPSFGGAIMGVWKDSPPGVGRVRTFFTGVRPRAVSNGINSAIFFCFYEALRSGLVKAETEREQQRLQEINASNAAMKNSRRAYSGVSVDAVHYSTPSHVGRVTEASMTLALAKKNRKNA